MKFDRAIAYWASLYDLYRSYEANEKFRGISYQGDMNQYFCNVQIRFAKVLMNPLEIFLMKKWTPYVTVSSKNPRFFFNLPETDYIDINDGFDKIKKKQRLIMNNPNDVNQWWKFPISSIEYEVDLVFTGSSILNVIGTVPLVALPEELREDLTVFTLNGSDFVQEFLIHSLETNFERFKVTYFSQSDLFTEAQIYNRYLRFISHNPKQPNQTLQFKLSHVIHDAGIIHFLNGTKDTLALETGWYKKQLSDGAVNPDNNQYFLVVSSNIKTFFGFCFFTNWVTANENFMIPMSRKDSQILDTNQNENHAAEKVFHNFMIDTLYSSMKFLLNENKKENMSSIQIDDTQNTDSIKQRVVNTCQIYGCIPGTAEIRYMLRIRGETNLSCTSTLSTPTKENERASYPASLNSLIQQPELKRMAKLISQVKQSLSA